jgi:hypothetical protein
MSDLAHEVANCPCGKKAAGSFWELRSFGWRWSCAFSTWLCRECFAGVLRISQDRGRRA